MFEPSLRAWEKGWTPNPDVWCNKYLSPLPFTQSILTYFLSLARREVKFGALLDRITHHSDPNSNKAPWLATGSFLLLSLQPTHPRTQQATTSEKIITSPPPSHNPSPASYATPHQKTNPITSLPSPSPLSDALYSR